MLLQLASAVQASRAKLCCSCIPSLVSMWVMQYFVEANAIAVRRVKKEDLKRIAKATGGQVTD